MELLMLPFMQRALIGGILVSCVLAYFGIFVILRRSSFFGDAVAHSSLTGVALGILLGLNPLLTAMLYAVMVSFVIPLLRKETRLPIDTLLGILLPVSMAVGVILLSITPGYQPELMSFLFGSILGISWGSIYLMIAVSVVLLTFLHLNQKKLFNISFDPKYATLLGIRVSRLDMIYHAGLAIAIVLGIQLVGIVLVNALLIIPAATARLFATSLATMILYAPIIAAVTTIGSLVLSYYLNLPSGPTIAVMSGLIFVGALLLKHKV